MAFPVYWMVSTAFKPGGDVTSRRSGSRPTRRSTTSATRSADLLLGQRQEQPDRRRRGRRSSRSCSPSWPRSRWPSSASRAGAPSSWSSSASRWCRWRADHPALHHAQPRPPGRQGSPGVIVTYVAFVLPFCVWTLRGFIAGIPKELEEAAMVDGSTRFGAFVADPAAARRSRPRRDLDLRLHPGLERVHHRLRPALEPGEADAHDLARELHDGQPAGPTGAR